MSRETRYKCDRCEREIGPDEDHYELPCARKFQEHLKPDQKIMDLCDACTADFREWFSHNLVPKGD